VRENCRQGLACGGMTTKAVVLLPVRVVVLPSIPFCCISQIMMPHCNVLLTQGWTTILWLRLFAQGLEKVPLQG